MKQECHAPLIHLQTRPYLAVTIIVRMTTLRPCCTEQDEEDEMLRNDDPLTLWPEDWADNAPWRSFARHDDPVGQFAAVPCCLILSPPCLNVCVVMTSNRTHADDHCLLDEL